MLSTTAFLAVAMQCAASVHPDTAQDVARVESGFNPYAIAEIVPRPERRPGDSGVISHLPKTRGEALSMVERIRAKGRRYSVGLMQITSTNFNRYHVTAERLFDPCTNLGVFEQIIVDCYQRGGTLKRALSCYYSGNFATGQKPEADFRQTSYVQRIGYSPSRHVVPSSRAERGAMASVQPVENQTQGRPQRVWPAEVVRSAPGELRQPSAVVYYPAQVIRGQPRQAPEEASDEPIAP